ncbi:hypothetical protein [Methanolobus sp.]|uniref:hypothetical protein n=1 Tax=Methanolobus sp. TaxID=1874737 RepID=UPI0025DF03B8|nr:hypothetical protein [Methanolobus sp.]
MFDLAKDHIKLIILVISLPIVYWLRETIYKLLIFQIQIWQGIVFTIALALVSFLITSFISKKQYDMTRFGLLWKVIILKNRIISLKGPFCKECDCDISHRLESTFVEDTHLSSPKCQKNHEIKAQPITKIKDDVKRIIESDLKSNKILEVNWSFYGIEKGFFEIKNKGIFNVTDIDIFVSANIGGENKTIGTYTLNSLDASESYNLNDKITEDLGNLLVESDLISLMHEEIPEEQENYYGENVTYWRPFDFIRLRKNFKYPMFVDLTYKLKRKQKIQKSKFLLTMKSKRDWKAYDYYQFDDDCNIKLERVN